MLIFLFYYRIKGEFKMPDILKYKSVAVPISTWKILKKLEKSTQRSPSKQIAFLVEIAKQI